MAFIISTSFMTMLPFYMHEVDHCRKHDHDHNLCGTVVPYNNKMIICFNFHRHDAVLRSTTFCSCTSALRFSQPAGSIQFFSTCGKPTFIFKFEEAKRLSAAVEQVWWLPIIFSVCILTSFRLFMEWSSLFIYCPLAQMYLVVIFYVSVLIQCLTYFSI